jgi:hypothetical protein
MSKNIEALSYQKGLFCFRLQASELGPKSVKIRPPSKQADVSPGRNEI